MTTAAFDQSVTDEINRYMGYRNCPRCLNTAVIEDGYCGHCRECTLPPAGESLAPHIAKIPLRAEYQAMLQAADLYDEQAAKHFGQASRLKILARQAREQAENLKQQADL